VGYVGGGNKLLLGFIITTPPRPGKRAVREATNRKLTALCALYIKDTNLLETTWEPDTWKRGGVGVKNGRNKGKPIFPSGGKTKVREKGGGRGGAGRESARI